MVQAAMIAPGQIRHLLSVTDTTGRNRGRDCLILLLGITCGMRVSEKPESRSKPCCSRRAQLGPTYLCAAIT